MCLSLQHRDSSLHGNCALGFSNKWRKRSCPFEVLRGCRASALVGWIGNAITVTLQGWNDLPVDTTSACCFKQRLKKYKKRTSKVSATALPTAPPVCRRGHVTSGGCNAHLTIPNPLYIKINLATVNSSVLWETRRGACREGPWAVVLPVGVSSRSWGSYPRTPSPRPSHRQSPPGSWRGCHARPRHLRADDSPVTPGPRGAPPSSDVVKLRSARWRDHAPRKAPNPEAQPPQCFRGRKGRQAEEKPRSPRWVKLNTLPS